MLNFFASEIPKHVPQDLQASLFYYIAKSCLDRPEYAQYLSYLREAADITDKNIVRQELQRMGKWASDCVTKADNSAKKTQKVSFKPELDIHLLLVKARIIKLTSDISTPKGATQLLPMSPLESPPSPDHISDNDDDIY